jgi:hypothetical protein
VVIPISGEKRIQLQSMKSQAIRLYSSSNIKGAEVKYLEFLQVLLMANGNRVDDREYVQGVANVNRCRAKLGLPLMGVEEEDDEENEVW